MADVIPPDTRAAGQFGHVADHNNIADVLNALQGQLSALPSAMAWGTATLVAGAVTVASPVVLGTSKIFVSRMASGGTVGHLFVPTITSGVSFAVHSSSVSDTSVIAYLILNP